MVGYIKLHRRITHWEWYTDINTKALFLHCLLMANHKDKEWRGVVIQTGSFITSLRKLAVEVGLTVSQVRTSLNKLEMTQEIAQETHTQNTLIKVLNYTEYQGCEKDTIAHKTHTKSQPNRTRNSTPNSNNQEYKENKNDKNIKDKEIIKEKIVYFADAYLNEVFEDFIDERKKRKQPMSERAITIMVNKINNLNDNKYAVDLLQESIMNGWKGIFPKNKPKQKGRYDVLMGDDW